MRLLIYLSFFAFLLLLLLMWIQKCEKLTTRALQVRHLVTRYVFSGSIYTCFGQTRGALEQNFVLTFFKAFEMDQNYWVSELRLNNHLHSPLTPNIIPISHVYLIPHSDRTVQFFTLLPKSQSISLLQKLLRYLFIWAVVHCLGNHVVDGEAASKRLCSQWAVRNLWTSCQTLETRLKCN